MKDSIRRHSPAISRYGTSAAFVGLVLLPLVVLAWSVMVAAGSTIPWSGVVIAGVCIVGGVTAVRLAGRLELSEHGR